MRRITVTMNMTLDGVVQGPGRPDEDTRDDFDQGGWGAAFPDDVLGQEMGRGMSESGAMLFGRRTWQDFLGYWPEQRGNPFTEHLDSVTKYVASTTLADAHAWKNSVLLPGDAVTSVAALKAEPGPDLSLIGSCALVRVLHAARLVDRYTLLTFPIVLGSGRRMFEASVRSPFTLVSTVATTTGVIITTYERASERSGG